MSIKPSLEITDLLYSDGAKAAVSAVFASLRASIEWPPGEDRPRFKLWTVAEYEALFPRPPGTDPEPER